jgi:hypothetical protein
VTIHVVEPTLRDQTGHCYSFVKCLVDADDGVPFEVWAHRDAGALLPSTTTHAVFGGFARWAQEWCVLRRLLRSGDRVLIATASRTDLLLLHRANRSPISDAGRVFAYVHWFRDSPDRRRFLTRIARRHTGLEILCPTESMRAIFADAGFEHVRIVAYPRSPRALPPSEPTAGPAHLLFAGAARADKGFARVVDLVAQLHEEQSSLRVTIQCSPTHKGHHPPAIADEVRRLRDVGYPGLDLVEQTVDAAAYDALFNDALVVQPYDAGEFADRVSGVTLDALTAGCPMIVPAETWMGRCVQRFDAGVTLSRGDSLRDAIDTILGDWQRYRDNAASGGRTLVEEHDARHLLDAILGR